MPLENRLGGQTESRISIPQDDNNIGINPGRHCPRSPRSHRRIPLRPDPISGFRIPRYFEKALALRTGRTRILFPSLSNSRWSPTRTPRMRRASRGTVICPLLVILACFCTLISCFLTLLHFLYCGGTCYLLDETLSSLTTLDQRRCRWLSRIFLPVAAVRL